MSHPHTPYVCTNPRCRMPFNPASVARGEAAFAAELAARGAVRFGRFAHICGECRTIHHLTDDRAALRPLTPNGRLEIELFCPAALRAAEAVPVGPNEAVLLLSPREPG